VAGCADNSVRLFDLRTGAPAGPVLRGHVGPVGWVSTVRSDGRDLVVSAAGGPLIGGQAETRFWDLDRGAQVGPALHENRLGRPLATAEVSGRGVLVTSAPDGAAVWDIAELLEGGAP
jgi:WD40 repeat protein